MNSFSRLFISGFYISIFCFTALFAGQESPWEQIDEGLFVAEFDSPQKATSGNSKITILKIDPELFEFKLMMASEHGGNTRSIRQWATEFKLVAAINAGMYQKDYLASVGFMKSFNHVNNPNLNKNNTIFAFNSKDSTAKSAQIIDRTCQDFDDLKPKYHSFVQSIRMVSCHQKNVWAQQPTKWSISALGMDKSGNVLFIFSRSPYSVHDFINILLSLPISLYNAMYLEGGSKAALYFSSGESETQKFGEYEIAGVQENDLQNSWPIPNVLGIVKK